MSSLILKILVKHYTELKKLLKEYNELGKDIKPYKHMLTKNYKTSIPSLGLRCSRNWILIAFIKLKVVVLY